MSIRQITDNDMSRLEKFLQKYKPIIQSEIELKQNLADVLHTAQIVDHTLIPEDVVTMNSSFILYNITSQSTTEFLLVYSYEAKSKSGKISIVEPLGIAVLGKKKGDTFSFSSHDGIQTVQIQEILFQPEAQGIYEI